MSAPPILFDRDLLSQRRNRIAGNIADFLHREIAAQVSERRLEVNRTFTSPAIVGPFPEIWAEAFSDLPAIRQVRDDETLDLQPGSHDLIVHGLGLHWINDPVGQLVQCRHALRPDGLLIAALFGGQTLSELRTSFAEAEVALTGGLSPRVAPMGDVRDLGGLIQRAGLALPVSDGVKLTVTYETPLHLLRDLRAMGETNVLTARHKMPLRRDVLAAMSDIYTRNFSVADDRVAATFEVVFLTGWKPSADQPKPLRPGSASHRLAEALGTSEISTGEKAGK